MTDSPCTLYYSYLGAKILHFIELEYEIFNFLLYNSQIIGLSIISPLYALSQK